jgi:hypothetical protein
VAGLLEERPGFTVLQVPPVPRRDAPSWARTAMRSDGSADFAASLPGAELEGLYELRTAGELLKLGARLDAYLEGHAQALREPDATPDAAGPWASDLPYRLLTLAS